MENSNVLNDKEREIKKRLGQYVFELAEVIGERNVTCYKNLQQAADYIQCVLQGQTYPVYLQEFTFQDKRITNIEAVKLGTTHPEKVIVVGAHYDSMVGTSGANDNASGVAATLEIAKLLALEHSDYTIRFVAFANEEPPFIRTKDMGSYHYARHAKEHNQNIIAMFSLETIGYYSDKKGSQKYFSFLPDALYPHRGNFIAFVGNSASRSLVKDISNSFAKHSSFPYRSITAPSWIPGVNSSDQWSFWKNDYPGIMITDTAPLRYPYYHTAQDTYDKINFTNMAILVNALSKVIIDLATVN